MNRKQLKSQAKGLMKTASPRPLYVSIAYVVILIAFAFLSYKLVGQHMNEFFDKQFNDIVSANISNDYDFSMNFEHELDQIDPEQFMYALEESLPSPVANLLNTLLTIMGWVIGAGFTIFALRTIAGTGASVWNLFDGFGMFFRIIWLYILEAIFVFLWALLFVIPGFIAFYRYRMAIYLLLEHPEMSALECISESKRLMKGHKWELFVLDLSFIGWAILVAVANFIGAKLGIAIFSVIGLGYLVYVWFLPYRELTLALYYKQLTAVPYDNTEYNWNPEF